MASTKGTVGPGEFSGTGGRKGRPEGYTGTPEQEAYERHIAAFRTDPADPASGEAQGDAKP